MKWYRALPLGTKILAGFLVVAGVSGLSGILAAGSIYDVAARAERMYTGNLVPISGLPEMVREYQTSLCLLRDIVIDRSEQERVEHQELLKRSSANVEKGLVALLSSNRSPQAAALQKKITEDLKLLGFFRDKIVDLAASGRQDEAVNIMRNQGGDVIARIDSGIGEVVAMNKAQAGKRHAESTQAARFVLALSAPCLSMGVAAALAIGYFLSRSITAPLSAVAGKVAEIAAGDLTVRSAAPASTGSRNQLHLLSLHLDQMAQTLHSVVSRIVFEAGKLSTASGALDDRSAGMVAEAEAAGEQIEVAAELKTLVCRFTLA